MKKEYKEKLTNTITEHIEKLLTIAHFGYRTDKHVIDMTANKACLAARDLYISIASEIMGKETLPAKSMKAYIEDAEILYQEMLFDTKTNIMFIINHACKNMAESDSIGCLEYEYTELMHKIAESHHLATKAQSLRIA